MMLLLLLVIASALGGPLSQQENEDLQRMCGLTYRRGRYRRSMNTKQATRYEAPFTVLIHYSDEDDAPRQRIEYGMALCTGTIISPRHILTSAHCLGDYHCKNDGYIYVTNPFLEKRREYLQKLNYFFVTAPVNCQYDCDTVLENLIMKPKRAFINKDFIKGQCGYNRDKRGDIAIIELEEDIEYKTTVQPACLYTEKVQEDTILTMYGYGSTHEKLVDTGILRTLETVTVPKEECSALTEKNEEEEESDDSWDYTQIFKDEICSKNERAMACGGDSGSGLILSKDNLAHVAAVTSWGPECYLEAIKDSDGVIGAGLYHHLDWICAATGVCPKRYLTSDEKTRLKKKYIKMGLSNDFKLEPVKK